jgi:hypothetical protein
VGDDVEAAAAAFICFWYAKLHSIAAPWSSSMLLPKTIETVLVVSLALAYR